MQKGKNIDGEEFQRILRKTRLQARGAEAARLVWVKGKSKAEASRIVGLTRPAVGKAVLVISNKMLPPGWGLLEITCPDGMRVEILKMCEDRIREFAPQ